MLPDGRVLWLFGDTFTGEADANNVPLPGYRLYGAVSAMVQSGRCFTPLMGGSPGARTTLIPSRVPGTVCWMSEGYVDGDVSPPVVRVWAMVVRLSSGGFSIVGTDVITLALPSLAVVSTADAPPPSSLPTVPNVPGFGASVLDDGSFVYFYGRLVAAAARARARSSSPTAGKSDRASSEKPKRFRGSQVNALLRRLHRASCSGILCSGFHDVLCLPAFG